MTTYSQEWLMIHSRQIDLSDMTSTSRSLDEALFALQASVNACVNDARASMRAKDRQIQELEEELAKYRRQEEIHESLIRAQRQHILLIQDKRRICSNSYDLYRELERWLSMDDLHEHIRAYLEKRMIAARERFHEVYDEVKKEERKLNELVKSLDAL